MRGGRAYLFERHMERARRTCVALGYRLPDETRLRRDLHEFSPGIDLRVRVVFERDRHRIQVTERVPPDVPFVLDLRRGFSAAFPPHKVTDYTQSTRHLSVARAAGFDEVALHDGLHLIECATANLGFVRGCDVILCKSEDALSGVTEGRLSELARSAGFAVERREVRVEELSRFDGAFLMSAIRGVVPVRGIADFDYEQGLSVGRQLSVILQDDVERELGGL